MKGKVIIECDDNGTHVEINMNECEEHDPLFLTHALGKALGLSYHDYAVIGIAEIEGVLDPTLKNSSEVTYES